MSLVIETARPIMESMVHLVTGARLLSLHHDISTVTGEEVMLFTLAEVPDCRQPKKRQCQESELFDGGGGERRSRRRVPRYRHRHPD
ncbi:MAG TPA: Na-translocating system protein MpsC family protein [Pirellulaceae bacterium]|nr:Na-translocating system protein MpsC family protein [Pirellulaceae bacterium]